MWIGEAEVLSIVDAATRLGVTKPRIVQLLKERCTFAEEEVYELESPEGRPTGTVHVPHRTVTLPSIEAYEERHPREGPGGRRRRHSAPSRAHPASSADGGDTQKGSKQPDRSSSVQVLRLELEHQLYRNQQLVDELEAAKRDVVERARQLNHQIVDLEADAEVRENGADSLKAKLAGLQSAFDAYGEVFTRDLGPQDPSDS